ncbi:MAG: cytochrome c maturation protein CcmE [Nitrospira defluvii]|nr:cytochrome c maturation protein CcmE [Nitrospira defluvii]
MYNSSIMLRRNGMHSFLSKVTRIALMLGTLAVGGWAMPALSISASGMVEVTELLAHPDHYDHQAVTVSGRVTSFQLATNRDGHPAFGFLLQDSAGTVKVVGLGKADVREGDYVVVEGVFSRLRQAGRAIVYNEIKATSVQSMARMNPDLVG